MMVNHFYDGMSPTMKKLLETLCGGDFLSKNPDEAMDFLSYVAETSKAWDEPNPRETDRIRLTANQRGGMYSLLEDMEMKAKLSTLTKRLEELEGRRSHEVRAVEEAHVPIQPCFNCQSTDHQREHCLMVPSVRDMMTEHANAVGQYKPQPNAPYGNTYNPNGRNHPNLSWKPNPPAYVPPSTRQQFVSLSQPQPPPSSSPVKQAILNLSKVVGNFVEEQKGINVQFARRIDTLESTLNKKIDGLQSDLNHKIDNLQYSITRITNLLEVQEKRKFHAQTHPNPRGVHEIAFASEPAPIMDEVKAITTLRSGKKVEQPVPKPVEETKEEKEVERITIKEDSMEKSMPPPFPQALKSKKNTSNQTEILEVLK